MLCKLEIRSIYVFVSKSNEKIVKCKAMYKVINYANGRRR